MDEMHRAREWNALRLAHPERTTARPSDCQVMTEALALLDEGDLAAGMYVLRKHLEGEGAP